MQRAFKKTRKRIRRCGEILVPKIDKYMQRYGVFFLRAMTGKQFVVIRNSKYIGVCLNTGIQVRQDANALVLIHEIIHFQSSWFKKGFSTCGFLFISQDGYSSFLNEGITVCLSREIFLEIKKEMWQDKEYGIFFGKEIPTSHKVEAEMIPILFNKIALCNDVSINEVKTVFYKAMFWSKLGEALKITDSAFGKGTFRKIFQAESITDFRYIINNLPESKAVNN